ncbi:MAG TPA: AsmA family protein, partial [Candidatus Eisenbacteria bacterium]|nr:AsmA family protein [Candidatus Eisenbacteria bacterium]
GRFYLRQVEITNLHTTTKIDGGHVLLNPFQLALNGAPVNASDDVDLGVPGYKYDVSFDAKAIPLAPLVNTFEPDRKDQVHGTLTAQSKIAGAGTTGANLKKNLNGQFDVNSTNLNLSVVNIKSRLMKSLINVVAMIPELLRNPEAGVSSLLGSVTGLGSGGLTEELKRSPIDAIIARGAVGSGRMDLQQAVVQSVAFRADAAGAVTLADILTNSAINIPVSISLGQGVAQRIGVSTNSLVNGYAKLPDFYTLKGTVGEPKNDINKLALLGMAAKGITGIAPNLGGKAGNLLQGLGGLVPGQSSSNTNASTNQPASSQSPANDILNLFKKPKK